MGERTGSRVLQWVWPYVTVMIRIGGCMPALRQYEDISEVDSLSAGLRLAIGADGVRAETVKVKLSKSV
ncbi:hypothetical protein B0T16DRAFT_413568 [Cercophora newfieldiana]|uniref:Uncharacterized protein n=1 Tax=Cercophora newfieldiana TaxID=92897 RepID=A0AA39Y695_9PEZI|nr:hypothetical protein B0T16DRAFT_413568 [Cercophora newfieldiana]